MTKAKLWHGFLMVGGSLAVLAPDLTGIAASLAGLGVGWLNWVARGLGILALIGSRWDVIRSKVSPLLGPPSSGTPVVALLALGTALLLSYPARAEAPQALGCVDTANTYCVVPATAVGMQLNLQNGSVANGVVLLGAQLQHTFGSLPLGAGIFGGLGASSNNQRSYQACGGLSITNWGLMCIGAQRATFSDGSSAWQGMLTLAGQLTFGGTPSYVAKGGGQ
jgi:hypothetical protein